MVKFFLEPTDYKSITINNQSFLYKIETSPFYTHTYFYKYTIKKYKKYFLFGPDVEITVVDYKPYFTTNFNIENIRISKNELLTLLKIDLELEEKKIKRREEILKGELI